MDRENAVGYSKYFVACKTYLNGTLADDEAIVVQSARWVEFGLNKVHDLIRKGAVRGRRFAPIDFADVSEIPREVLVSALLIEGYTVTLFAGTRFLESLGTTDWLRVSKPGGLAEAVSFHVNW